MGNALRFLSAKLCERSDSGGHHGGVTVGVSALAQDLYNFEITNQVPRELCKHVVSSRKAQCKWYKNLAGAWRETKPPPKSAEEASRLVIRTLKRHQKADVELTMAFLCLTLRPSSPPGLLPPSLKVSCSNYILSHVADLRESANVPRVVQVAADEKAKARARRNYGDADELHKLIIDAGYRVIKLQNEEVLAKKYRIQLRGIDAPEHEMPFGQEAKEEQVKIVQNKCLRVLVFGEDRYGRCVGDVYCNDIFVQELMIKKGIAWHYKAYDRRPELDKVIFVVHINLLSRYFG
ncbi:hypothetical protein SASPL_138932 [Salvia splendens]|uniref:TNase-like domain-containing protein n=1 Tax=Salvia splendens TaxID=180675 RepID=A0A8X8WY09_SALSN|nr:hypothetical protein SASPL_138932 [Salvia splendens]